MPILVKPKSYPTLLKRIQTEIQSARKKIELTKALTYWKIGEHISKHLLSGNGRAGYGDRIYKRLSKDLDIDARTLRQSVQFHREIPIVSARSQLDWTHYRKLIAVDDLLLRNRLLKKVEKDNLTTRQLADEIRRTTKSPSKLTPKRRGQLTTYQIISSDRINLQKGQVLIDCGFNFSRAIKRDDFKGGKLVKTRAAMSFTYKAYPLKVVDGDTVWVVVDLGLDNYTYQKLRLRGINAPEMKSTAGKRAKQFVERALKDVDHIIIRTSASDKYDRYLADIYYGEEGEYLNQELIDNRLAVSYQP